MPIKDQTKRREYQRELMRKKRSQGLTENVSPHVSPVSPSANVSPIVSPSQNVSPDNLVSPKMLDPDLLVRPIAKVLDPVSPVRPEQEKLNPVRPCQLNHLSLSELWQQAKEQVKQAWQEIIQQGGTNQCYNCHNSQRNHQLALNLLEKYWGRVKKGGQHE